MYYLIPYGVYTVILKKNSILYVKFELRSNYVQKWLQFRIIVLAYSGEQCEIEMLGNLSNVAI